MKGQKNYILLDDSWEESGTKEEDFYEIIRDISRRTSYFPFKTKELEVLSYLGTFEHPEKGEMVQYHVLSSDTLEELQKNKVQLSCKNYPLSICGPMLEDFKQTGIVIRKSDYWMTITEKTLDDICPINLNMLPKGTPRNLALVAALNTGETDKARWFLVREENINGQNHNKIFNSTGSRYKYVPQEDFFFEATATLSEDFTLSHYKISNFKSELWLKRKDTFLKNYEVGFYVATSDTSECGYILATYIASEDACCILNKKVASHSGRMNIEDFFNEEDINKMSDELESFCKTISSAVSNSFFERVIVSVMSKNPLVNGISKKELKKVCAEQLKFSRDNDSNDFRREFKRVMKLPGKLMCESSKSKLEGYLLTCVKDYFKKENINE